MPRIKARVFSRYETPTVCRNVPTASGRVNAPKCCKGKLCVRTILDTSARSRETEGVSVPSIPELRLARVETMYAKGQWREMHDFLSNQEGDELPASLALFDALACIEGNLAVSGNAPTPVQALIRAMERLLGVPEGNPLALLLAKRLVRKPPVTKRTTSWKVSAIAIAAALAIGLSVGWVLFNYFPELIVLEAKRPN